VRKLSNQTKAFIENDIGTGKEGIFYSLRQTAGQWASSASALPPDDAIGYGLFHLDESMSNARC